ncbi:coiled-coil-helix-coiled-coil-helix domain-containing protein 5-like [Apostichopus japonicus]|uniref:coiled-coil-helix-coiled-coil-helix domain-containing protein 5-like n=1 Tax=Stichopus japonicus TaxID=307972 RepID=UPI003AB665D9
MEAVMTLVMKYCSSELEDYAACVANNPQTWNTDCEEQKLKAADCSSNSPAVKKINKVCAEQYVAYEKCLNSNPESVEVCVNQLQSFLECAEAAARTIPIAPVKGK